MNGKTLVVLAVVAAVLLPTWFVALQGEPPSEEIAIDRSVSEIHPLEGPLDTPNKLLPSQVGVIVWVALFALLGALAAVHRFMNRAVRPPDAAEPTPDGGRVGWSWIGTEDRWVVDYRPATERIEGLVAMGGLTVVAIAFAALFTGEYLTLARTQYFGLYAAGMFVSLALSTVAYYAWFLPHVEVAERRGHEP